MQRVYLGINYAHFSGLRHVYAVRSGYIVVRARHEQIITL